MDSDLLARKKTLLTEVLKDFDDFCREHGIDYFISYGTLLGAVRHGGFIPWDDDADVSMHIDDCLKLQKAWKKYGNKEKYFLQNKKSDPYLPNPFWRIRVNGTTGMEKDHSFIPLHWGIPLDIFPIYNAPKSKVGFAAMQKIYNKAVVCCAFSYNNYDAKKTKIEYKDAETKFFLTALYIISKLSSHSGIVFHPVRNPNSRRMDKSVFFPTTDIQFDNLLLRSLADPQKYLSMHYGEDYMTPPPETQRDGHSSAFIDLDNDYRIYINHIFER